MRKFLLLSLLGIMLFRGSFFIINNRNFANGKRNTIQNTEELHEEIELEPQKIEIAEVEQTHEENKAINDTKTNTAVKVQERKVADVNKTETKVIHQTPIPTQAPNVQVKEEIKNQEVTPEPTSVPAQPKEEYRVNNNMISTITNYINNNPSQLMKNNGFNVIVDSSIIGLTNPYTYSEYRTQSKIQNKFGTIKIYARDYYLNGTYIETECYIY